MSEVVEDKPSKGKSSEGMKDKKDRKTGKSNKAILRAGKKSSKRVIREAKLNKTRAGRVWYGFTQRLRWPAKNSWSELANLERDSKSTAWYRRYHYRIPAIALAVLVLISWSLMYVSLSQTIGGVRLNSFILQDGIVDGTARAVQAVGDDGSLVMRDGSNYPAGSYEIKAVIQAKFGWPYYSPVQKALLIPYDWGNVFMGGIKVWMWVVGTAGLFFLDKFMVTSVLKKQTTGIRNGMKYYEAIYSYYPRSLRLIRWATVIVMIFTIGFLLWPLI